MRVKGRVAVVKWSADRATSKFFNNWNSGLYDDHIQKTEKVI